MNRQRIGKSECGRRDFLARLGLGVAAMTVLRQAPASPETSPQTVAALAHALQRETDAHRRYVAFAVVAQQEGYKGIAYMFTAFAASEGVHARNFRALIAQLGGAVDIGPSTIMRGTTKEVLIAALDDEIDSIDQFYPRTLERLKPEGHGEADRLVRFAWNSERQHRDLIQKIRRYSPLLFEQVAKAIDEKTGLYFVCQTCGSTLNKVPSPHCPVCAGAPEQYHPIPIPGGAGRLESR